MLHKLRITKITDALSLGAQAKTFLKGEYNNISEQFSNQSCDKHQNCATCVVKNNKMSPARGPLVTAPMVVMDASNFGQEINSHVFVCSDGKTLF